MELELPDRGSDPIDPTRTVGARDGTPLQNGDRIMDSATEYERRALDFLRVRDASSIGDRVVRQWARKLPPRSEVVEIACGGGYPITRALSESGLQLWAIDSSSTLLAAFERRFPHVPTRCERVQESTLFDRTFDAAVAIGLLFLLPEVEQCQLIRRTSDHLKPGGRFLFTAPIETGRWEDLNTGTPCHSLGLERYQRRLQESGLRIIATMEDAGENHYFETEKPA